MSEEPNDTSPINTVVDDGLLSAGTDLPDDFDPLEDGILMAHQVAWLEDKSPVKIAEKCRRSGFTFAEALDDTITAATLRSDGGDNVFYIGDTKEKGREFINYCATFAKTVAKELILINEFMFEDKKEDGGSNYISAFRITFGSGNQIVALSSRPENIRGLQGIVVIDEAAFHKDVGEVIDAALALLIWGGRIRIISTHNGKLNAFNELITQVRAGKKNYSLHRITFDEVIENGLYDRVKLMRPDILPFEEWYATIRGSYLSEAREKEELDAIPSDSEGAALTRVQIEACLDRSIPVLRIRREDKFLTYAEDSREREMLDWCRENLAPILEGLHPHRRKLVGGDIARKGHAACLWLAEVETGLRHTTKAVIEMRNLPFENMRHILFYILDRLTGPWSTALDASGLGMDTAEKAVVKYGAEAVGAVTFSNSWYLEHGPKIVSAVEDQTITVPADEDIITDLCGLAYVQGVVKIPDKFETIGADGGKRHADGAIAALLVEYAASLISYQPYAYQPVKLPRDADARPVKITAGFRTQKGAW